MKKYFRNYAALGLLGISILPFFAQAATFKYGAWLPFWKKQTGALEIAKNLDKFSEISPFSYEVRADGTLIDDLKIDQGFWPGWFAAAHDLNVKIIPTIALLYGDQSMALLSNTKRRQKHEDIIAALVKTQHFDGIDIDYEDKSSSEKSYFNLFLKGLAMRLHPMSKTLSCTIETRTPLDSLVLTPTTTTPQYANDYVAINTYCDEVRIMAYDQGTIDLKLNATKGNGAFYAPVADPDWISKVLALTVKTISRKKIMLGIPTYGYQYEVTWANGVTEYKRLRSETFTQAMDLADAVSIAPVRNSAGELSLVFASSTPISVSAGLRYDVNSTTTPPIYTTSTTTGITPTTRYVSFTDASAIQDKINLAKKYGLRGVIFFKMDGETDPGIWDELK